ncbi:MAG: HPr family phosphocarrier protein [Verrucomicrobiae bacterium]|nr:HPr family phosphocarrier protein [Verrucomicrobiae bacterium]
MPVCELTITNEDGLHARPAAKFVKLASRFTCDVWVEKDEEEINGKSIMGLMMLAAAQGSIIKVSTEGEDADLALEQLSALVKSGFESDC